MADQQWDSTDNHQAAAASGGWQTTDDHVAPPAYQQPQGSAASRFLNGAWNTTLGGVFGTLKAAGSLAYQTLMHPNGVGIDPNSDAAKAIANVVQSHIDQAQRAKAALDKGDYSEAFGHTLATAIPLVGPAAAHAAERMGGTQPTFDKYGNVVTSGQAPDVAGGLGEGAGLVASTAAPGVARAARAKLPTTLQGPPLIESTLNPVEQSAVDYLKEQNVPVPPGTLTGNRFVKAAQAVTQTSPLGSVQAADFNAGTEAGLRRVAGDLSDQVSRTPATPESAATAVTKQLQKKIGEMGLKEDAAYSDAWLGQGEPEFTKQVQTSVRREPVLDPQGNPTGQVRTIPTYKPVNMPVDLRDIKAQLKPVFDEMQWMPAADRASSAGYQAVKNILEGDDYIPAWQAEKGLGGLKTMARVSNQSGVRNTAQGLGASIIPQLQEEIDAAVAETGDHAIRGLQQGRATHASKMDIAELTDQLSNEPVQTFQKLTWKNDTGIAFLRKIADQAPDTLQQVGRAYVDQLFDQATREGGFGRAQTILSQWQKLGPETKKLLFPDGAVRSGLDRFFKGAEMLSQNPNPSGTALVQSAGSLNPLRWAAGYAGSKLLYTPAGVKILTDGLQIPLGGPKAQFAQSALQNLWRKFGPPATAAAGSAQPQQ